MTDQKKLARQWAESRGQFENRSERERAAAEFILANTESETMMGREWVHAEHHMAGADWEGDIPVVMIDPAGDRSTYVLTVEEEAMCEADDEELTPNGKRYELREIVEPDHPEVLTTVEEYENAPEGTIVSGYSRSVSYKINHRRWEESGLLGQFTGDEMAGNARDVLRWGKGYAA